MLSFDDKPIVGMIHLPPLPGSPRSNDTLSGITAFAVQDAETLLAGGVDALMIENFGDAPFFPGRTPAITVASITCVASEVKRRFDQPLGINVLRNDGGSALAIAAAVGADFIRVNVLCGARVTDQGVIQGIAHDLLRQRRELNVEHVQIFADVDVKHSVPLAARPLADEVADTLHRGGADALIVSGVGTGSAVEASHVEATKRAAGNAPVLIGSGTNCENIQQLAEFADGFIVGSALKSNGQLTSPVELTRVESMVRSLRDAG
ncbi:MAG: BtpA/SgcQ family protein [Planctomycetota bacterium]